MATNSRYAWHSRIKGVELEFVVARSAVEVYTAALDRDDVRLPAGVAGGNVRDAARHLEGTYLIRLFAAFEAGLRSYWAAVRDTDPQARDLIDAVAARRDIPLPIRDDAHRVREHRNGLIHERADPTQPFSLAAANQRLNTFFARLPDTW